MEQFVYNTQQLLNIRLSDSQVDSFRIFQQELSAWNEKFNLTAIRDNEQIRNKHFAGSSSATDSSMLESPLIISAVSAITFSRAAVYTSLCASNHALLLFALSSIKKSIVDLDILAIINPL